MKEAANQVISDAGAGVYAEWCPAAAAKLAQIKVLTSDLISQASSRSASVCSNSTAGPLGIKLPRGAPRSAAQTRVIAAAVFGSKPLREKVTDVVTTARKCGCPPSVCLFCRKAAPRSAAPAAVAVPAAPAGGA